MEACYVEQKNALGQILPWNREGQSRVSRTMHIITGTIEISQRKEYASRLHCHDGTTLEWPPRMILGDRVLPVPVGKVQCRKVSDNNICFIQYICMYVLCHTYAIYVTTHPAFGGTCKFHVYCKSWSRATHLLPSATVDSLTEFSRILKETKVRQEFQYKFPILTCVISPPVALERNTQIHSGLDLQHYFSENVFLLSIF